MQPPNAYDVMKSLGKMLVLILLPLVSMAQQNPYWQEPTREQADSLKSVLAHTHNDSTRVYICRELGLYYQEIQRDSSLHFLQIQLGLAQRLNLKLWEAEAFSRIGHVFSLMGNYPESLKALLNAQSIAENEKTEKDIWKVEAFSKDKDPRIARLTVLACIHGHLGVLYLFTNDMNQRLFNYFESRKIAETINDKAFFSLNNMNLGEAYIDLEKLDSALAFEQSALHYCNESGYYKYKGFILYLIGSIYSQKENYDSAKKYFTQAVQINQEQQNPTFLGMSYVSLANLFLNEKKSDSSLNYAKKALEIYRTLNVSEGMLQAFMTLTSIYKSRNNLDSAFFYQGLAMAAKDSVSNTEKLNLFRDVGFDQQLKVQEMEKEKIQNRNKIRTYVLLSGLAVVALIAFLLYRNNRIRKKAHAILHTQKEEIEEQKKNVEATLSELRATQAQLIQSEKMASLGELTAGIAHEIQNPLNFVNNFSEVNRELIDELKGELAAGNLQLANEVAENIKENEQKINHHGKRAGSIVKSMLQHSRTTSGKKEPTDLNALTDEYLRLAYHGLRAKDKSFHAKFETHLDKSIGKINVVPQEIGRVILNLINNGFYAATEKKKNRMEASSQ